MTGSGIPVVPATLLLLLLCWQPLPAATQTGSPQPVSIQALWEGRYQAGHLTEIHASWLATQGGPFLFSLHDGQLTVSRSGVANLYQQLRIALPFAPLPGRPLHARLTLPGGETIERELELHASSEPQAIIADNETSVLPQTRQGYDSVASIDIHTQELKKLSPQQLRALEDFLADCGTIVLRGPGDEQLREGLKDTAGCGARTLLLHGEAPAAEVRRNLPSGVQLQSLLPDKQHTTPLLLGLALAAFFALLLGAVATRQPRWALLAIVLLGSAALPLLAHLMPPSAELASWAEMQAGDSSARFVMHVRTEPQIAGAENPPPLTLPASSGVPRNNTRVTLVHLRDDEIPQLLDISGHGHASMTADFNGVGRVEPGLQLLTGTDGRPVIQRNGPQAATTGWLSWQDYIYRIPALAAGESWSPEPSDTVEQPPGALRAMLRSRALGPALLLPMLPFDRAAVSDHLHSIGWLLVRYPKGMS